MLKPFGGLSIWTDRGLAKKCFEKSDFAKKKSEDS